MRRAKIAAAQDRWDRLTEKISKLQASFDLETRVEEKMRLEPLIKEAESDRQRVEDEIRQLNEDCQPDEGQRKNIVSTKHVFLSYCRENADQVERLRRDLVDAGLAVWWDQNIDPGETWQLEIRKAMKNAHAVVLCLSEEATARQKSGIFPEARDAIDMYRQYRPGEIFLIPVRLSECEIPFIEISGSQMLDSLQYVDLFPEAGRQRGFDRLIASLRKTSGP